MGPASPLFISINIFEQGQCYITFYSCNLQIIIIN